MEKLIIPKNCVLEGAISGITHEGDIQLENGMIPPQLTSEKGNIRVVGIPTGTSCKSLMASAGEIDIQGETIQVEQIVSQSLTAQFNAIESQSIQTTAGTTYINGEKITLGQLSGDSVVIEGETVHIGMLRASGTVQITAKHIHVEQLEGTEVTVAGQFESAKVTASEGFYVTSGHVAIKNLDAPSFSSDEGVGGIVMVATCEKVITQGVRGFLRPAELGLFSKGGTTMDLSEILGTGSTPMPMPSAPSESVEIAETMPEVAQEPEPEPEPENDDSAAASVQEESSEVLPVEEPVAIFEPELAAQQIVDPNASADEPEESVSLEDQDPAHDDADLDQEEIEEISAEEIEEQEEPKIEIDLQQLSARTTVVVDDEVLQDEDGEMKTIQLEPERLAEALKNEAQKAQNLEDDLLEATPAEPAVQPIDLEDMVSDSESNDGLNPEQEAGDSAELPEIEGFDDYHSTGEIFGDNPSLDEPLEAEEASHSLEIPDQDEDLWEEQEDPSEEIQVEALDDDIEVEELSEDDFFSVDEEDFEEVAEDPEFPNPETRLRHALTDTLNQIRDFFPDENYPKFIYQIQNYVNEGRFSILAKPRNRDAVLSSFEKLNHPDISKLSDKFYSTLAQYFEDQED